MSRPTKPPNRETTIAKTTMSKTTIVQLIIIVLLVGLCLTLVAIRSFRHPPTAFVDQRARF